MNTILLLEDDQNLNRGISLKLRREGYDVLSAFTVREARELFRTGRPDMIISDITLPDGSGLEFCSESRRKSSVFILFLTALDSEIDMVSGYDMGADDYITKPFSLMVLVSKVHAFMRRVDNAPKTRICSGGITVSYPEMNAYSISEGTAGSALEPLPLSKKELQPVSYTHLDVYKRQIMEPGGVKMAVLLIIEDDTATNEAICEYMRSAGHTTLAAFDGEQGLEIAGERSVDLVILDIMLPKRNGLEVLKELRQMSSVPVLMLTALDDEPTQAASFDEQADDYITKPFSMLLLGKRVTALLRRCGKSPELSQIRIGDITVDFGGYTASGPGGSIDLTPKEIDLLKLLVEHKGLVLTRSQILDELRDMIPPSSTAPLIPTSRIYGKSWSLTGSLR